MNVITIHHSVLVASRGSLFLFVVGFKKAHNVQDKRASPLRYGLDDWPPLGWTVLLGLPWAAIIIPSIIILGHVIASL